MAINPPVVPMTTFTDYVLTPGGRRITLVRQQINQLAVEYNPGRDFYRPVNLAIEEGIKFRTGTTPLDGAVQSARDIAARHFKAIADGVAPFVRRAQKADLTKVGRWGWRQPSVTIRINPDFALRYPGGEVQIVKLYLKEHQLDRFHADALLRLIEYALPHLGTAGTPVVVEARRGKIWKPNPKANARLDEFLRSEALSFGSLWQDLSA